MAEIDRFRCVCCALVYIKRGLWDLPRCPRCGALSNLFPERLAPRCPDSAR
jgi:hypothetical protein